MSSIFDKRALFYVTCIPFFVFFLLFGTIVYPNRSLIQPPLEVVQRMLMGGGSNGFKDILANLISNWTSALYYVVSGTMFIKCFEDPYLYLC
jgi:AAA family ATP:ADP antiporter